MTKEEYLTKKEEIYSKGDPMEWALLSELKDMYIESLEQQVMAKKASASECDPVVPPQPIKEVELKTESMWPQGTLQWAWDMLRAGYVVKVWCQVWVMNNGTAMGMAYNENTKKLGGMILPRINSFDEWSSRAWEKEWKLVTNTKTIAEIRNQCGAHISQ